MVLHGRGFVAVLRLALLLTFASTDGTVSLGCRYDGLAVHAVGGRFGPDEHHIGWPLDEGGWDSGDAGSCTRTIELACLVVRAFHNELCVLYSRPYCCLRLSRSCMPHWSPGHGRGRGRVQPCMWLFVLAASHSPAPTGRLCRPVHPATPNLLLLLLPVCLPSLAFSTSPPTHLRLSCISLAQHTDIMAAERAFNKLQGQVQAIMNQIDQSGYAPGIGDWMRVLWFRDLLNQQNLGEQPSRVARYKRAQLVMHEVANVSPALFIIVGLAVRFSDIATVNRGRFLCELMTLRSLRTKSHTPLMMCARHLHTSPTVTAIDLYDLWKQHLFGTPHDRRPPDAHMLIETPVDDHKFSGSVVDRLPILADYIVGAIQSSNTFQAERQDPGRLGTTTDCIQITTPETMFCDAEITITIGQEQALVLSHILGQTLVVGPL